MSGRIESMVKRLQTENRFWGYSCSFGFSTIGQISPVVVQVRFVRLSRGDSYLSLSSRIVFQRQLSLVMAVSIFYSLLSIWLVCSSANVLPAPPESMVTPAPVVELLKKQNDNRFMGYLSYLGGCTSFSQSYVAQLIEQPLQIPPRIAMSVVLTIRMEPMLAAVQRLEPPATSQ